MPSRPTNGLFARHKNNVTLNEIQNTIIVHTRERPDSCLFGTIWEGGVVTELTHWLDVDHREVLVWSFHPSRGLFSILGKANCPSCTTVLRIPKAAPDTQKSMKRLNHVGSGGKAMAPQAGLVGLNQVLTVNLAVLHHTLVTGLLLRSRKNTLET